MPAGRLALGFSACDTTVPRFAPRFAFFVTFPAAQFAFASAARAFLSVKPLSFGTLQRFTTTVAGGGLVDVVCTAVAVVGAAVPVSAVLVGDCWVVGAAGGAGSSQPVRGSTESV